MNRFQSICVGFVLCALTACQSFALEPGDDDLYCRVVDVGAGQSCVIKIPGDDPDQGDYFVVFDTGNWKDKGKTAMNAVREISSCATPIRAESVQQLAPELSDTTGLR